MVAKTKFHIIAYAALGEGLSGSDNILIELSRRWADKLNITIYGGKQIKEATDKKNLIVKFNICPSKTPFHYVERLFHSLKQALTFKQVGIVYTASDFPHDLLCGWIIKLRKPVVRWVAGYYLVAPPPFSSNSPYHGLTKIRGIGYWLMQRFTLRIVRKWADLVYVTSVPEKLHFPNKKVVVVKGGVNIPQKPALPYMDREYDAVFMGRFHYQKGVLELIDIWKIVTKFMPKANLLMIGNGSLYDKCKDKVYSLELSSNINFVPFANRHKKEYYFTRSKIVVHPATYDSGGMSAAEGMVYGLPCVAFDLPVYKTYYKEGILTAPNKIFFAMKIINLLKNRRLYNRLSQNAYEYIRKEWDWNKRAKEIWEESGF